MERILHHLAGSGVPDDFAVALVNGAPPMWREQPEDVVARDVRFCHPVPAAAEVRVSVQPLPGGRRWTVWAATRNRSGLLAESAGVLTRHGLSIDTAVAATWEDLGLAMQRYSVSLARSGPEVPDWGPMLEELHRRLGTVPGAPCLPPLVPASSRVRLGWEPLDAGRGLLAVSAPDRVGLLWSIASRLEQDGCDIELASASSLAGVAQDLLVVLGTPDLAALGRSLAGPKGTVRISQPRPGTSGSAQQAMSRLLARSLAEGARRTQGAAHRMALRRSVDHARRARPPRSY